MVVNVLLFKTAHKTFHAEYANSCENASDVAMRESAAWQFTNPVACVMGKHFDQMNDVYIQCMYNL